MAASTRPGNSTTTGLDSRRKSNPELAVDPAIDSLMDDANARRTPTEREQEHCQSSHKNCRRLKLKGFDFCHKHILEDKNSPFQRCCFMSKSSGKQCTNPAPKIRDKKTFCLVHTRNPKLKKAHAEQLKRKKNLAGQPGNEDADRKYVLRQNLSSPEARHSRHRKRSQSGDFTHEDSNVVSDDLHTSPTASTVVQTTWFGDQQSDAESVDSEDEDPLKHAGVWTLEEGIRIYCNKLRRLKTLYKGQYNRLTHVLKERRRKHLIAFQENGKLVKEGTSPQLTEEDRVYRSYQKLNGVELLLLRQAREKRARVHQKMTYQLKCHHSTQGQRCQNKVLPMAKYCLEHVCEDSNQFLYKQCTFEGTGQETSCNCPVFNLKGAPLCDLHTTLRPPIPNEALDKVQNDKKLRDLVHVAGTDNETATTNSPEKDKVDVTSVAVARTTSPGNIFSILESDDPKGEKTLTKDTTPKNPPGVEKPKSKEEEETKCEEKVVEETKPNEQCEKMEQQPSLPLSSSTS